MEELIISWYREMHSLYLRDKGLIPRGNLVEVRFEDLEKEPLACLERIYRGLDLPGFAAMEETAAGYLERIKDYRKNEYTLTPRAREKVAREWGRWFREYGYRL